MLEPKAFYRKIETALQDTESPVWTEGFSARLLPRPLEHPGRKLGVRHAQLYPRRKGDLAVAVLRFPERFPAGRAEQKVPR